MPQFVELLTEAQSRLYAYIRTLMPDCNAAHDVLQNTNMVLWSKSDEFQPGSNFNAWSTRVAYFEVLAYRKRRAKDRHVFDVQTVEALAQVTEEVTAAVRERESALEQCLQKLTRSARELVWKRYGPNGSVKLIAAETGKTVGAISQTLYRIRTTLAECVEASLTRPPP